MEAAATGAVGALTEDRSSDVTVEGLRRLYIFPAGMIVVGVVRYQHPYDDPIAVREGDLVQVDDARSAETDFLGWRWCRGPDGREGWTPAAWLDRVAEGRRIKRDFNAMELDVEPGDRFVALYAESGFVFVETSQGRTGRVPDAVLAREGGEPSG